MDDWCNNLRLVSFMDTVSGALELGHRPLLAMAAAMGTAVGESGRVNAHGYLNSLLLTRDAVLQHNRGVDHLSPEVQALRVAPPLHSELLPGAVVGEQEVFAVRRQKAERQAWGSLNRGLQSLAIRPGEPGATT